MEQFLIGIVAMEATVRFKWVHNILYKRHVQENGYRIVHYQTMRPIQLNNLKTVNGL